MRYGTGRVPVILEPHRSKSIEIIQKEVRQCRWKFEGGLLNKVAFLCTVCPICPVRKFLNETHEFSELVMARMALLTDQSSSVLQLRSFKVREFGEWWRENMFARTLSISLKYNWQELSVLFVRQDRTNGKLYLSLKMITVSKTRYSVVLYESGK